jgi:hypothetical protein
LIGALALAIGACAQAETVGGPGSAGAGGASAGGSMGGPGTGGRAMGAGGAGSPTTGAGGAQAGSGGAPGTGGAAPGTGGSPGAAGATGACAGVPIMPDATGMVASGSNSVGIHGSWFEYSDCTDLKNMNCSTVTTPPMASFPNTGGKMCTSGHTSMASGAWGAGIGLELNDGPPQMPYDTTAHNVVGFCFVLSGNTIPSTSIRVAFPTQNNNDNAWFSAVTTPGQHTVLFSDTAQGSWVTTKSPFEPKAVMLLQFQIPSSTTASIPWDFCVEGLTAVTQ